MSINFSIIIPHYNCPNLLERCLNSIPQREDVEVIIVDDHSSPYKVDFIHFPGLDRSNCTCVFSDGKLGKGPGYARNMGLGKASGKWIIFCDSDDYLLDSISDVMDRYVDSSENVIYFKCSKEESNGAFCQSYDYFDAAIDLAITGEEDELLYYTPSPCAKFIRREYLNENHIAFQDVIGGDDILFSIELAKNTVNRKYVCESFYCVVMAPESLTRTADWHRFYNFTKASCSAYRALKVIRKENRSLGWIVSWWGFLWAENKYQALLLIPYIIKVVGVTKGCICVKKGLKRGKWDWKNS